MQAGLFDAGAAVGVEFVVAQPARLPLQGVEIVAGEGLCDRRR